jgi:hypothetical protein
VSYEEKLKSLNLTSLEERRWRYLPNFMTVTEEERVEVSTMLDLVADKAREGATATRNTLQ